MKCLPVVMGHVRLIAGTLTVRYGWFLSHKLS